MPSRAARAGSAARKKRSIRSSMNLALPPRERRYRVEDPAHAVGGARREERRPRVVLVAGDGDEVEIVGDLGPPEQLERAGRGLAERQDGDQPAVGVAHVPHVEPPALREHLRPVTLPGPAQEGGSQAGGVGHGVPGGGLRRIEVVGALDLHRSSDGPAVPGDSPPASAGVSPPASPASVIASSTAESKSSPSSSPNSLPIFFMKRATLVGSPSSRSPSPPPSASDSRRASSDFTVAKRDISRLSAVEPQRGHAGVSGEERRRTSRLTRRRQSWHSYS